MENNEKNKFFIFKFIVYFLVYIILCLLAINTAIGYINFKKIQEDKKPYLIFSTKTHENDEELITSYWFGIYKIITVKRQESITYNFKLWFNKDF